jgi:hypothetical protein
LQLLPPVEAMQRRGHASGRIEAGDTVVLCHGAGEHRAAHAIGNDRSLVVVGTVRTKKGNVRAVHVASWDTSGNEDEVAGFFGRLRKSRIESADHGRIEISIVEGCAGNGNVWRVIDEAWRLSVQPAHYVSATADFAVTVASTGAVYHGALVPS